MPTATLPNRAKRQDAPRRSARPRPRAERPPSGTVFHEPWWLEAVTDGQCRTVEARSGGITGTLPFVSSRRMGVTVLRMPPLSYVAGPVLVSGGGHDLRESQQAAVVRELLDGLPRAAHISFRLHDGFATTLAFDGCGYRNTAEFTAEIAPAATEALWTAMKDKTRNTLRRAAEQLTVRDDLDERDFLALTELNLHLADKTPAHPRSVYLRAVGESLRRGTGRVIATAAPGGEMQAAVFTVWDRRREYYLLSTRRPDSGNGAVSLALWTALQNAAQAGRVFDLAGVHVKPGMPNLNLLSGFGGVLRPRYVVRRTVPWLEAARPLAEAIRRR